MRGRGTFGVLGVQEPPRPLIHTPLQSRLLGADGTRRREDHVTVDGARLHDMAFDTAAHVVAYVRWFSHDASVRSGRGRAARMAGIRPVRTAVGEGAYPGQ
ncbi:hypothetical protein GCM10014713_26060 [Streptomyces purpureus]|uniref:Uncharacterized protein n=1 Tax=Streptomyces purpureus TaxID=1951 RepID=A0A918H113_9ACTN|nr:hypothetical protein GCM10014713_26060 [Streptomyces purpureus]